jgi:hypothetical protein
MKDESSSSDNAVVRTDTVTLKRSIFDETDGTVRLLNALKVLVQLNPNKSVPVGRVEG